jgi:hypothetical protein
MSWHGLLGIAALNAVFLVTGSSILWALRAWTTWAEWAWLAGVGYLVGVATVCVASTVVLVAGGDVSLPAVLALAAAAILGSILVGRRIGVPWPRRSGGGRGRVHVGLTAIAATAAVVLVDRFRASLVAPLSEWDAWAVWTYKAKSIYLHGGLDGPLLKSLPGATYPLLIPSLEAMDFHFMGSTDDQTLHVQFWLLAVGFLWALVGLLRRRVALALFLPIIALLVVTPRFATAFVALADLPLAFFFSAAALSLAVWLTWRERWTLVCFGIFGSAAMATKREGQLLLACLVLAALIVTVRRWRRDWLPILGTAIAAYLPNLPWRIYWESRGFRGEGTPSTLADLWHNRDRIWPSFRLVVDLFFDVDHALVWGYLALAVALAVLVLRRSRTAALYLLTLLFAALGYTWITWAIDFLPTNPTDQTPIPRAIASLTLLSAAFVPLLAAEAIGDPDGRVRRLLGAVGDRRLTVPRRLALVAVAVVAAAYLAAVSVAAATSGSGASCPREVHQGGLKAVYGEHLGRVEAQILQQRAHTVGLNVEIEQVGCTAYDVVVRGIPNAAVGENLRSEAASAGFAVRIVPG